MDIFGRKISKINGLAQVSEEDFQNQTQELTKLELAKLYASKEYRQTVKEKGKARENWNWQTRDLS